MSSVEIISYSVLILVGQYVLWRLLRRHDTAVGVEPETIYKNQFESAAEYARVLRESATADELHEIPAKCQQLHPTFADLITHYRSIQLDVDDSVYNRSLLIVYDLNPEYVRIGVWPDGSAVLARRNTMDPRVYIDDVEQGMPGEVRVLAVSLEAYLAAAKDIHCV